MSPQVLHSAPLAKRLLQQPREGIEAQHLHRCIPPLVPAVHLHLLLGKVPLQDEATTLPVLQMLHVLATEATPASIDRSPSVCHAGTLPHPCCIQ